MTKIWVLAFITIAIFGQTANPKRLLSQSAESITNNIQLTTIA